MSTLRLDKKNLFPPRYHGEVLECVRGMFSENGGKHLDEGKVVGPFQNLKVDGGPLLCFDPKIVIGKNFKWRPLKITSYKKLKYKPLNILEVEENRKANGKEILLVNRGEKIL